MGNKKIYIIAKVFDQPGCLAYLCQTPNEARCLPGTLEALRAEGVQIVILDSPEIYSEYAPYSYIEDMKEFIDRVSQLNRVLFNNLVPLGVAQDSRNHRQVLLYRALLDGLTVIRPLP